MSSICKPWSTAGSAAQNVNENAFLGPSTWNALQTILNAAHTLCPPQGAISNNSTTHSTPSTFYAIYTECTKHII